MFPLDACRKVGFSEKIIVSQSSNLFENFGHKKLHFTLSIPFHERCTLPLINKSVQCLKLEKSPDILANHYDKIKQLELNCCSMHILS